MLIAGEQSTWPKLLFIANRMKIERLIEEGLLLGGGNYLGSEVKDSRGSRESMHLHGQKLRSSAEPSTETEDESETRQNEERRLSVLQEIKRQSGVFFDDIAVDEETGESEMDEAVAQGNEHGKTA